MSKRKAREDKINQVDLLKPLNVFDLGGKRDPCFGKLNDPTHPVCRRCGDCEVCAVVQGQKGHAKRDEINENSNFKDIEEEKIDKLSLNKRIRKVIKVTVRASKVISRSQLELQVTSGLGITKKKFDQRLNVILKNSKIITEKNNKISYNE